MQVLTGDGNMCLILSVLFSISGSKVEIVLVSKDV